MGDKEFYMPSKPRIEVGMPFGKHYQVTHAARNLAHKTFGNELQGAVIRDGYECKASIYQAEKGTLFKSNDSTVSVHERKIVDSDIYGLAGHVTYSGFSDPEEYITYSNGYNGSTDRHIKGDAPMNYIETTYRGDDGQLHHQYAIDKDGDGYVGEGEVFDSYF